MPKINEDLVFSNKDIIHTYAGYDCSEEARESILYFVSELTGISVDSIEAYRSKINDSTPDAEAERHAFRREAYRLYQLDWMANHGYGPMDLAASLLAHMDGDSRDPGDTYTPYRSWELDAGFGGECWACISEFLDMEYRDRSYMPGILPGNALDQWIEDLAYLEAHGRDKNDEESE